MAGTAALVLTTVCGILAAAAVAGSMFAIIVAIMNTHR